MPASRFIIHQESETMSIERFYRTFDIWTAALQHHSIDDLTTKPAPTSWSMGQLFNHLISETQFYISRIEVCAVTNRNSDKEMTSEGKEMFLNNSFPDERLQGAPSNSRILQPKNKEELVEEFIDLGRAMN